MPRCCQVAVEARLVDRGQRAEAHRHRRELPELRHQPRVRIRGQAAAGLDLLAEVVEVILGQPALEKSTGVDARRGVTLEEDLVAHSVGVLAAEEMVEADFVQRGGAGVRREVATDSGRPIVGAQDHRHGVPADHAPDAVARSPRRPGRQAPAPARWC